MKAKRSLSIAELEKLLNSEDDTPITIMPNGQIRKLTKKEQKKRPKILTLKNNLGGEYGRPHKLASTILSDLGAEFQ